MSSQTVPRTTRRNKRTEQKPAAENCHSDSAASASVKNSTGAPSLADTNENDNNVEAPTPPPSPKPKSKLKPLRRSPRRSKRNHDSVSKATVKSSPKKKRPKRKRKSTEKLQEMQEAEREQKIKKEKQRPKKTSASTKKRQQKDSSNTPKKQQQKKTKECQKRADVGKEVSDGESSTTSSLEEKDIICCVCHCGVDFSEKDAFYRDDNISENCSKGNAEGDGQIISEKEEKTEEKKDDAKNDINNNSIPSLETKIIHKKESQSLNDESDGDSSIPYCGIKLPLEFYDPNNAIIICDSPGCNRSYHQRCHFVPILCLPRGKWHCLICQYKEKLSQKKTSKKKKNGKSGKKLSKKEKGTENGKNASNEEISALSEPLTVNDINSLFPLPRDSIQPGAKSNEHSEENPLLPLQERFEFQSASLKISIIHTELKRRIKTTIDSAIGAIRLEEHTIRGFTETERAKKSLVENFERSKRLPQQLVQSVHRVGHNKMRIRELMLSLDKIIRNRDDRKLLKNWFSTFKKASLDGRSSSSERKDIDWDLLESKLFTGAAKRSEPRFDIADYDGDIEDENDDDEDLTKKIKCSVCFSGQVQPDNDVIMCDGKNCFRAFHMKCCSPVVTQKMLDDDEHGTWFCPYCCALANFIHYTQTEYLGDEIDEDADADEEKDEDEDKNENEENEKTKSWDEAKDVFPEAAIELSSAKLWKNGQRDDASDKFLSSILGLQLNSEEDSENNESDHDDDESDKNFSSAEEEDGNSLSDSQSDSSLSNSEAVDLKWDIDKAEVDALSSQESDGEDEGGDRPRRTRSSSRQKIKTKGENKPKDIGTLDQSNIIFSKRNRTKVDYRRLNGSLFGEIDGSGNAKELDDDDEYDCKNMKKRKRSDSSSCESGDGSEDNDDGSGGSEDGSEDSNN